MTPAGVTRIAIAVVEHDDCFLVGVRPADVPLAGMAEFPGGKVERDESIAAAAKRECLEETGLPVRPDACVLVHTESYEHGTVELHFWLCFPENACPQPKPPFRWVKRSDLGSCEFPSGNRKILERLLRED